MALAEQFINGEICMKYFTEICFELAQLISSTYNALKRQQTAPILSPNKKQELFNVGPAITYQPGGYATQRQRQQGPWAGSQAGPQNVKPAYRSVYDICGGVINRETLLALALELGINIPEGYSDAQLCAYVKEYIQRYQ